MGAAGVVCAGCLPYWRCASSGLIRGAYMSGGREPSTKFARDGGVGADFGPVLVAVMLSLPPAAMALTVRW